MGQAKNRGTHEERAALAIEKRRQEALKRQEVNRRLTDRMDALADNMARVHGFERAAKPIEDDLGALERALGIRIDGLTDPAERAAMLAKMQAARQFPTVPIPIPAEGERPQPLGPAKIPGELL